MGPAAFDGRDKGFDEVVVVLAADSLVEPADVEGVFETVLVVGTDVEEDGQAVLGWTPARAV